MSESYDVVVVGGGNAGFSAALAAREHVPRVLVMEKAPSTWAGGNSWFTAGAFRLTYESVEDLLGLVDEPDIGPSDLAIPPYLPADFEADLMRVTLGRCDTGLAAVLAADARPAAEWMRTHGVRWTLQFDRQSFRAGGVTTFWGNLPVGARGGGAGLVDAHIEAARRSGIDTRFDCALSDLVMDQSRIVGVRHDGGTIEAGAVVLAAGGFEADPRRRAAYLGPGWDLAKVRGTPYNTGEVLEIAISHGARPRGHWSGCHAIAWDAEAGDHGDRATSNRWSRQGYPFGLVVNTHGRRFIDEGADFRNYTYAKYGAEILRQTGSTAFQLFDAETIRLVSETDYATARESRLVAETIGDLGQQMGTPAGALEREVAEFNAAVQDGPFDPAHKDGKKTVGIDPPKSNWAMPMHHPPFYAYRVTCGITFTFGGLATDPHGRVLDATERPIPGLFAAGEILGGLFYHNYPGGSGLTAGTVFGRRAGRAAAGDPTAGAQTRLA